MEPVEKERCQISIIFTDQCNMRCTYCTTAKRETFISSEVVRRVVAIMKASPYTSWDINFHGGEPTLAWDRIVEFANLVTQEISTRTSFNLCTNGTNITDERAQFLAANRFDVRVSIDGKKEAHTLFRKSRKPNSPEETEALYDRSLSGLQTLIRNQVNTSANMVVSTANVDRLLSNMSFLLNQGLVHLIVSPVVGEEWSKMDLWKLNQQLTELKHMWQLWMRRVDPRQHEDLRRSILSEIDRATYCIGERMNQPDAQILVIGANGRIFGDEPDLRTERSLVLGDVFSTTNFAALETLPQSAFQMMYQATYYSPEVLLSVKRTHRLLRKRLFETYQYLFPGQPMHIERREREEQ